MSRKLLFFFDGSSNRVTGPNGVIPTNVFHLNQAFSNGTKEHPQISFYFSGVGTHGDHISAATGRGFDEIVIEAYTNLASNYVPGDQIYLFGFSRGAAAARVLSALIADAGLLRDSRLTIHFPDLWNRFTNFPKGTPHQGDRDRLLETIRPSLWNPKPSICFLGAFDTVPGYSWDRRHIFTRLRIRDLNLEDCVRVGIQLLAADDNRVPSFAPLLWDKVNDTQIVEQLWLPGVHGDIGGHSDGRFIGNIALLTMLERVEHHCPELDLDHEFIAELEERTFDDPTVQVTNERPTILYRAVLKGARKPGHSPGEAQHELLCGLASKAILLRGQQRPYRYPEHWAELPHFHSKYSGRILDVLSKLS